jgi:hypothetical protein
MVGGVKAHEVFLIVTTPPPLYYTGDMCEHTTRSSFISLFIRAHRLNNQWVHFHELQCDPSSYRRPGCSSSWLLVRLGGGAASNNRRAHRLVWQLWVHL